MQDLEKGQLILINEEVWRIVGDYTEVDTPLDYEIQLVENSDIWETYRKVTIVKNIKKGDWSLINV